MRQANNARDAEWDTFTCVLGFDVMGVWPHGTDGTDVNAACRSNDLQLLATGDDSGLVKLFNFPVVVAAAPNHALRGHSSHVMNVRWLADSQRLVSVGGHDQSVVQCRRVKGAGMQPGMAASGAIGAPAPAPPPTLQPTRAWKASTSWK